MTGRCGGWAKKKAAVMLANGDRRPAAIVNFFNKIKIRRNVKLGDFDIPDGRILVAEEYDLRQVAAVVVSLVGMVMHIHITVNNVRMNAAGRYTAIYYVY
jgi:hypothetical protein